MGKAKGEAAVRPFEVLVLWTGIALSVVLIVLSIRGRNPALSGLGVLLGALSLGTMRELRRRRSHGPGM